MMPPFDATVLSSTKEMPRTKLLPYSHDATGLIIASVKTPPHVTLSIPMNHRCHGVMAGTLTNDGCHDEPLLPNDATDLLPHSPMEVPPHMTF